MAFQLVSALHPGSQCALSELSRSCPVAISGTRSAASVLAPDGIEVPPVVLPLVPDVRETHFVSPHRHAEIGRTRSAWPSANALPRSPRTDQTAASVRVEVSGCQGPELLNTEFENQNSESCIPHSAFERLF